MSKTKTHVKVTGVPETIKAMQLIGFGNEKSKMIDRGLKEVRQVVTDTVTGPTKELLSAIPDTGPLSRWNSREATAMLRGAGYAGRVTRAQKNNTRTGASRFPAWDTATVMGRVSRTVYFSRNHYPPRIVAKMGTMSAAGAVFEMAGRKNESVLAQNLTAKYGSPGRSLWRSFDRNHAPAQIQEKIRMVTHEIEREVQAKVGRR